MLEMATIVLAVVFLWSTLVVLSGLAVQLFARGGKAPALPAAKELKFAVVICAHNEARVIERPLKTIRASDYSADKIDIFVFADNCTDGTAAVAAAVEGVKVYEKSTPSSGKGDVLAWGLDQIDRAAYDAIAVFDADNEVDRRWFAEISRYMNSGANIVTGHRMSSNAFTNLITGWYTIYWNLMNELSNRVRSTLGLSAMLTGTGFAFRSSVLPAEGWRTNTFVEDLEFALMRNLEGHRIFYAGDAVFFDEQPIAVRPMIRQLNRWATGGLQVLWRYWWRWLKTLVRHPSLRLLDSLVVIALGVTGTMMIILNAIQLNWRFAVYLSAAAWLSAVLSTAFSRYSLRSLMLPILLFPIFTLILSYTVAYSIILPQRKWRPIAHGN